MRRIRNNVVIPQRIKDLVSLRLSQKTNWGRRAFLNFEEVHLEALEAWENPTDEQNDALVLFVLREFERQKKWPRL